LLLECEWGTEEIDGLSVQSILFASESLISRDDILVDRTAYACSVSLSCEKLDQLMTCRIANDFGASNEDVSLIPTLAQAGYATGILFISPLGDLVRRRPLVILLVLICSLLSIGLALAKSVAMLQGLTFLIGVTTVRPVNQLEKGLTAR